MLRILLTQVLPVLLTVLGIVGLAWAEKPLWKWLGIVGWTSAFGLAGYLVTVEMREKRIVRTLTREVRKELDVAGAIEYRMRDEDSKGTLMLNFPKYEKDIEDFRTRVAAMLEKKLPGTGASPRFLAGVGVPGRGAAYWRYTELNILRANLAAVLDSLPSYVARSE